MLDCGCCWGGWVALKYSGMVIKTECVTCILLSQITSPHPPILFLILIYVTMDPLSVVG